MLNSELAERFSYYGSTVVFSESPFPDAPAAETSAEMFAELELPLIPLPSTANFIQRGLPPGSTTGAVSDPQNQRPGALGLGQQASTGLVTFNSFWVYVTPIAGGYIADTYW